MKTKLFLCSIAFFSPHLFADSFTLVTRGDQVCKQSDSAAEVCYPILKIYSQAGNLNLVQQANNFPRVYEMMNNNQKSLLNPDDYRNAAAGFTLSEENRERLIQEFDSLVVRDIAIDEVGAKTVGDRQIAGFYGSVDWKDKHSLSGTILVVGHLDLPASQQTSLPNTSGELNQVFSSYLVVDSISDDGGPSPYAPKKIFQLGQRKFHFLGSDADSETKKLIIEIIGPATMGSFYVNSRLGFGGGLAEGMKKIINGLGKALTETGKRLQDSTKAK